jgi:hypothetical protein
MGKKLILFGAIGVRSMGRLFFLLAGILFSINSLALTEKQLTTGISNVTKHRMHSVVHMNIGVKNIYTIYINGLTDGCSNVYINAEKDPYLYSAAISGVSSPRTSTIQVFYHIDSEVRGPWGDPGSCQLTSFSVGG